MDITDRKWVVEVDIVSIDIATVIVHFGKPRHSYFEINVRNGKAGRLLI